MAPALGASATTLFSQPTVTRPSICGGTHYLFSHYLHYQQYIVNILLPISEKYMTCSRINLHLVFVAPRLILLVTRCEPN